VAIALLHTHFIMQDDEVLVEIPKENTSIIIPQKYAPNLTPYVFMVDPSQIYPLEFSIDNSFAESLTILENQNFISKIRELLLPNNYWRLLGIHFLHRHHIRSEETSDSRGIIETSDDNSLLLQAWTKSLNIGNDTQQTIWEFHDLPVITRCFVGCQHCHHCGHHCIGHK